MKLKIPAFILILAILSGCNSISGSITGCIIDYTPYSLDGKPDTGWTPSKKDILEAEPIILGFIKESNPSIHARIDQYRCQYSGIIINGEKRIFCNFFYPTNDEWDWKMKPVIVDDGGDWYFQLEYNVESKQCLNFSVNGEA